MLYSDEIYIKDFKRTYTEAYRQGFIDGFNERGYLLTYIGNDHIENQNDHIVAEQTEPNCSEIPNNCEPKICDTCRYYNSNISCGSTPSACKEADKFAEKFVDGLKKLKPKIEPKTSGVVWTEDAIKNEPKSYTTWASTGEPQIDKDINVRSKEPQTIRCPKCGRTDYIRSFEKDFGIKDSSYKYKCINCNTYIKDEPQTDCSWK